VAHGDATLWLQQYLFTMVRFILSIKTCCSYVIWEKQDQIWAKIFASPKICTPVHLCGHYGGLFEVVRVSLMTR